MQEEDRLRLQEQEKLDKARQVEPDQALASGQVLTVRVNWGKDTEATNCLVKLQNPRNGWYDEIEDTALAEGATLSSGGNKPSRDFPFGAENFNRQQKTEWYPEPGDMEGEYTLLIQLNSGQQETLKVYWDTETGEFEPNMLNVPF
jgi:hypothetical protein